MATLSGGLTPNRFRYSCGGTLVVRRDVPVRFQSMQCHVHIEPAKGTDPKLVRKLLRVPNTVTGTDKPYAMASPRTPALTSH